MIYVFVNKIYYNMVDLAFDEFFATRNVSRYPIMSIKNNCQLEYTVKDAKSLNIRCNSFSIRVVKVWNSLPENVVTASSFYAFKIGLSSVDLTAFCVG